MMSRDIGDQVAELVGDSGSPAYSRRLSDKILAAFTHAYSLGRHDIADTLLAALKLCSRQDGEDRSGAALAQAEAWMVFIQARNRYNQARTSEGASSSAARAALGEMKAAHRAWSET